MACLAHFGILHSEKRIRQEFIVGMYFYSFYWILFIYSLDSILRYKSGSLQTN